MFPVTGEIARMQDEVLRGNINAMANMFAKAGDQERSKACADFAVSCGLWANPNQRPIHMVEGLRASELHDPRQFETVKYLEENSSEIQAELDHLQSSSVEKLQPAGQYLLKTGRWDSLMFDHFDTDTSTASSLMPRTSEILASRPAEAWDAGVVSINWLYPNSHIAAHCGASNARLRVQLGLRSDPKAVIRIGGEFQVWEEGKCFVFDDSFEHEVWHFGTSPRIALICDIHHPDLPENQRDDVRKHYERRNVEEARRMVTQLGRQNLQLMSDGAFRLEASGNLKNELLRLVSRN